MLLNSGYWTATPTPHDQAGNPAYGCAGSRNKDFCGAGFGESADGLHWKTLPTPDPNIQAEVGGELQFHDTGRGAGLCEAVCGGSCILEILLLYY